MLREPAAPIDFALRRRHFLSKLKKSVAVFFSAPQQLRNKDVFHPYRQNSNFQYLTGFEEPGSICLLSGGPSQNFQLFVTPRPHEKGSIPYDDLPLGIERSKELTRADICLPSSPDTPFDEAFIAALLESESVYFHLGQDPLADNRILRLMRAAQRKRGRGRNLWPVFDPDEILGEMRLVKSKAEIQRLQKAASISAEGHVHAMRVSKPGMYEYEVEAALYHAIRTQGAGRLGYPTIVASGENACVLHYRKAARRMDDGDLLLIDAGAEYDYYTADISRVCPVSGKFSVEQRDIYRAVLRAQMAAIAAIRPGRTIRQIHEMVVEILTEELRRLKILKGPTASLLKKRAYAAFYPHATSHWLGMEIHDLGRYYEGRPENPVKIVPGMVFTVEPGLYFPVDLPAVPARYRGIGIRIEDDVVVTADGCKVMTFEAPKELDEVEALCSQG